MSRILLAEDDDSLRAFLARALERAGHEVRTCADGDEALTALNEGPYDLLLTDIVMPGADGIEVARVAAAQTPGLPIMFITGFAAVALATLERVARAALAAARPAAAVVGEAATPAAAVAAGIVAVREAARRATVALA